MTRAERLHAAKLRKDLRYLAHLEREARQGGEDDVRVLEVFEAAKEEKRALLRLRLGGAN